jgi:hypothetical protein
VCVRNVETVPSPPGGETEYVVCPIEGAAVPATPVLRP